MYHMAYRLFRYIPKCIRFWSFNVVFILYGNPFRPQLKKLNLFELDNTVLTLGSVNSVCCVQKDGILSRNSLAPEKIFFFHKQHHHHHHAHLDPKGLDSTCPPETAILDQDNQTELSANIPGDSLNTVSPISNVFLTMHPCFDLINTLASIGVFPRLRGKCNRVNWKDQSIQ